jgi:hypothetical protein
MSLLPLALHPRKSGFPLAHCLGLCTPWPVCLQAAEKDTVRDETRYRVGIGSFMEKLKI